VRAIGRILHRAATPPPPPHPLLPPSSSLAAAKVDLRKTVQMRGWRRGGHGRGTSPPCPLLGLAAALGARSVTEMCGSGGLEVIPGHPSAHGCGIGRSGGTRAPWAVGHARVGDWELPLFGGAWCGMEKAAAGGPGWGGWWPQQVGLGAAVRSGGPVAGFAVPEADVGCGASAGELPMVVRR
jgi:hypothetical protein